LETNAAFTHSREDPFAMNPSALKDGVKCWLDAALGFFYPSVCQLCDSESATAADGYVGARCRQGVRFIKPPFCECCGLPYEGDITTRFECANCREMQLHFRFARAAVVAGPRMLEVIHRYKYKRALWFEPFLAGLLVRVAAPAVAGQGWDLIVPVPLHPLKKREREFNQARRLAAHLGRAVRLPIEASALRRVQATRTQTLLTRNQRAANVRRAFAVRPGCKLDGRRIIIVDDVLTTGATTSACARALLRAGARDVCVWTVARGL
jgi:ComF family protein